MIEITLIKISNKQWDEIEHLVKLSKNYGIRGTFFSSIEKILNADKNADKVVTLNGKPLHENHNKSNAQIIYDSKHVIFKYPHDVIHAIAPKGEMDKICEFYPYGIYAVASKKLMDTIQRNDIIIIDNNQKERCIVTEHCGYSVCESFPWNKQ